MDHDTDRDTTSESLHLSRVVGHFQQAPLGVRHRFLLELLKACRPSDLSLIYTWCTQSPSLHIDFLSELPEEIAVHILHYLGEDIPSISRASRVNRKWNRLVHDNLLWQVLCKKRSWGAVCKYRPPSLRSILWSVPDIRKFSTQWRQTFQENYLRHRNWITGRHQRIALVPVADANSLCLTFDDDLCKAISMQCDRPSRISMWKMLSDENAIHLEGHEGAVSAAKIGREYAITGGADHTVRIWKLETGKCIGVLRGHDGEVGCLAVFGNIVASGGEDGTCRLWRMENGSCVGILRGHTQAVSCIALDHNNVISGGCDSVLRIWRVSDGICIRILHGHTAQVTTVQMDDRQIVSGSTDNTIKIWKRNDGTLLRTLKGHQSGIVCLQFDEHKIVSGSIDRSIKVWSMGNGNLLYTLNSHQAPIWSLKFDQFRLLSSSFDQQVLVWDFSNVSMSPHDEQYMDVDD